MSNSCSTPPVQRSCTCNGRPCATPCSGWCTPLMAGLPGSRRSPLRDRSGSFWALWPWGSLPVRPACKDGPAWRCSRPYRTPTSPRRWTTRPRAGLCARLVSSSEGERDKGDVLKCVFAFVFILFKPGISALLQIKIPEELLGNL